MSFLKFLKIAVSLALAASLSCTAKAQDASQLAFSDLQAQANGLVEQGDLIHAMPLLKELIKRVESTNNSDIELDLPIFLIGTGYIQLYLNSGNKSHLSAALTWYDKLLEEYSDSPKVKDALLKKVDVLRASGRLEDATKLMRDLLSGAAGQYLNYAERLKLLKNLTQTYYLTKQFREGLPYFGQLMEVAREDEDKALGAAASFEALIEANRFDDAIRLLPELARESEVRYRPRLNVALLKASDALVKKERLTDAALLLNLIKTTDLMIDYNEAQLAAKKARKEQREAFGNSEEEIEKLTQEIANIEASLKQLKTLPSLRNELLVRRARNYTKTSRAYEAFWMFYDLMVENPKDPQIEFYTFASFSNAMRLEKYETIIKIGRRYRSEFPNGDYISDVSIALAMTLKNRNQTQEFLGIATDFLTKRPLDPASSSLFGQWASFLMEAGRYDELLQKAEAWAAMHESSVFADGIHYWSGMARLLTGNYPESIASMSDLLNMFPTSSYAEDGLLRKGIAQFYDQQFEASRTTLTSYAQKYPSGTGLDQSYFFLGEVENLAGNYERALQYFNNADRLTGSQDIHDSAAFRIGSIYETLGKYEEMSEHFAKYIDTYGEDGKITDAILERGRALEYTLQSVEMLELYRETIAKYLGRLKDAGVDKLIEAYVEKYDTNKVRLTQTVDLLNKMENDLEFREMMVTDRGFLFEKFYHNQELDQTLYNRLRNHPSFGPNLMESLAPIAEATNIYREQLASFPESTPEDFYRSLLADARGRQDRVAEVRALMGLYRIGIKLDPAAKFDGPLLGQLTPRALLYVADYARDKNIDDAVTAWNVVLTTFPFSDSAIVAYLRLADVSDQRGDKSSALDYLGQIAELFPGSPQLPAVILKQGDLLSEMGRTDEARTKYQYILRVPEWRGVIHARALFQTGQSYMADGEYAKAHGFFERTFLGYSHFAEWSAKAYLQDAEALVMMGAPQDAITTLQEAIEMLGEQAPSELFEAILTKLKELQS